MRFVNISSFNPGVNTKFGKPFPQYVENMKNMKGYDEKYVEDEEF